MAQDTTEGTEDTGMPYMSTLTVNDASYKVRDVEAQSQLVNCVNTLAHTTNISGNAITSLTKNGNLLTYSKDKTFSEVGHTHNYAGSSSAGGAANSANKLNTARTITLSGDATGSVSFDGSGDVTMDVSVVDDVHTHSRLQNGVYSNGVVCLLYADSDTFILVPRESGGETVEVFLGDTNSPYAGLYTNFVVSNGVIQATGGNVLTDKNVLADGNIVSEGIVQATTQVYSKNLLTADGNAAIGGNTTIDGTVAIGKTVSIGGITTVSARIQPYSSNNVNLGYGDARWMGIYSNSSVNVSSDLTVKKDVVEIDDRYIQLFDLVQPYAYKFIDGQSGRVHTGFISQYVEAAMKQVGLSDMELGFFCKDEVTECVYDENGNHVEDRVVLDEDGNPKYFYSLRYEEYIAIMTEKIKRMEKRMNSLEERLTALENA